MRAKEHIKEVCLLGTDRRSVEGDKLPDELQNILLKHNILDESEKALMVLSLMHYYELSGLNVPKLKDKVEISPIVEDQDYINEALTSALERILKIENLPTQQVLLRIWMQKVKSRQAIIVPSKCIAYFMLLSKCNQGIVQSARSTFGKKGAWLIEQDDTFNILQISSKDADDPWSFGKKEERKKYIVPLIRSNPEKAIETIKNGWANESARDKIWILQIIRNNLDSSFYAFIANLYDVEFAYKPKESKSSRACRFILASCLLLSEKSTLHRDTLVFLSRYFRKSKGGILSRVLSSNTSIELPQKEDDFFNGDNMLKVYGIDSSSVEAANFKNDVIFYFSKLLSSIPFSAWSLILKMKTKNLLDYFSGDKQFEVINRGEKYASMQNALHDLAKWSKDEKLIEAMFADGKALGDATVLLSNLSPEAWERIITKNEN